MKQASSARPPRKNSSWAKTPVANLVRYIPSGTYFARVLVGGKLIRRSLNTDFLGRKVFLHAEELERAVNAGGSGTEGFLKVIRVSEKVARRLYSESEDDAEAIRLFVAAQAQVIEE